MTARPASGFHVPVASAADVVPAGIAGAGRLRARSPRARPRPRSPSSSARRAPVRAPGRAPARPCRPRRDAGSRSPRRHVGVCLRPWLRALADRLPPRRDGAVAGDQQLPRPARPAAGPDRGIGACGSAPRRCPRVQESRRRSCRRSVSQHLRTVRSILMGSTRSAARSAMRRYTSSRQPSSPAPRAGSSAAARLRTCAAPTLTSSRRGLRRPSPRRPRPRPRR